MHRTLEGFAQFLQLHLHTFHLGIFAPGALVITAQRAGGAVVPMARRELRRIGAIVHQRFQFRRHPQTAFAVVPPVQRHHTDRVACDDHPSFRLIPQRKRKDAVEAIEIQGRHIFAIQRIDHLAIGAGLEGVRLQQFGLEFAMVVDLAIDRQRQLPVFGQQRLRAAGRVDDGQALVHQDGPGIDVDAAPVRPAMALPLRTFQCLPA